VGHYPDSEPPDAESYRVAFTELVDHLAEKSFRTLFIGGVGTATLSRPRVTDDIDLLVHPEDAEDLIEHLADGGFETRREDPTWLYKAFAHGVLIDIIFRSTGDIYLDDDMVAHSRVEEFKGRHVQMVGPEDLLVIKAVASAEHSPQHWFDALGLVARGELEWDYLVARARRFGPRRVLALLLYAESNDLTVSPAAVRTLYDLVHSEHHALART
jgi:predicted nucleotidyltransferase